LEEYISKHTGDGKNDIDKEILERHIALIEKMITVLLEQKKDIKSLYDKIHNIKHLSDDLHVLDVFSKTELLLRIKD
jgi:hypothetical protein